MNANSNQEIYMDFRANPSLAEALTDKNPGDTFTVELEVQVLNKDDKGLSGNIVPGSIQPEGYELEDNPEGAEIQKVPSPEPPGSLAQNPVTVMTMLRKKGNKNQ